MRVTIFLDSFFVLLVWGSTDKNLFPNIGQISCKSIELLFDLVSKLSSVAEDQSLSIYVIFFDITNLMQNSQHKYCSFSHTSHSLTNYVFSKNCKWNALLLDLWWMFKTTFFNTSIKFIDKKHIFESSTLYSSVLQNSIID